MMAIIMVNTAIGSICIGRVCDRQYEAKLSTILGKFSTLYFTDGSIREQLKVTEH